MRWLEVLEQIDPDRTLRSTSICRDLERQYARIDEVFGAHEANPSPETLAAIKALRDRPSQTLLPKARRQCEQLDKMLKNTEQRIAEIRCRIDTEVVAGRSSDAERSRAGLSQYEKTAKLVREQFLAAQETLQQAEAWQQRIDQSRRQEDNSWHEPSE